MTPIIINRTWDENKKKYIYKRKTSGGEALKEIEKKLARSEMQCLNNICIT